MNELIGIFVPVFNVESYLPRCQHAISEQTYQYLEILFARLKAKLEITRYGHKKTTRRGTILSYVDKYVTPLLPSEMVASHIFPTVHK